MIRFPKRLPLFGRMYILLFPFPADLLFSAFIIAIVLPEPACSMAF